MEENLDNPQQDGQPNAELGPTEPRYQEEGQPAENSSSQYGWLQMRGQGGVWIGAWEIGKPPEADVADSSTYVQSNLQSTPGWPDFSFVIPEWYSTLGMKFLSSFE